MVDIVSTEKRSQMMAGIRGRNSRPEMRVRSMLHALGFRFRLHRRDLPGTPDIVLPGRHVAIFVHGCFWHAHAGCRFAKLPSTRREFWSNKLRSNVERDARVRSQLIEAGWRVLCVWECAMRDASSSFLLPSALEHWIEGIAQTGEISARTLSVGPQADGQEARPQSLQDADSSGGTIVQAVVPR